MSGHDESNLGGSALKKKWQMITIMSLKLLFPKLHRSCVGQYFSFLFIIYLYDNWWNFLYIKRSFQIQSATPHCTSCVQSTCFNVMIFITPMPRKKKKKSFFFPQKMTWTKRLTLTSMKVTGQFEYKPYKWSQNPWKKGLFHNTEKRYRKEKDPRRIK